jgi:hypothetical protein
VAALFTKRRSDAELKEEIETPLELLANEHQCQGMPVSDARAAARRPQDPEVPKVPEVSFRRFAAFT